MSTPRTTLRPEPASRRAYRLTAAIAGVAAAGILLPALPAAAHTEVSAAPARAGAVNAIVTFSTEAESPSAGLKSIRVVLPTSIPAAAVTFVSGPPQWKLTVAADGYTVSGPALPVGADAIHRIRVSRLPDATSLTFKAVDTYTDGSVQRWIAPPTATPEPDNPAAYLALAPAATTGATTGATTTSGMTPSSPAAATTRAPSSVNALPLSAQDGQATGTDTDPSRTGIWVAVILVALATAASAALVRRSNR